MERVKGIEPSYAAWEAAVLPLNYTREGGDFTWAARITQLYKNPCIKNAAFAEYCANRAQSLSRFYPCADTARLRRCGWFANCHCPPNRR